MNTSWAHIVTKLRTLCKILVFWSIDGRAYPKPEACQTQLDSRRQVDATTLSNVDLVYDPCVPITHTCGARMHITLHELAINRRMLICLL